MGGGVCMCVCGVGCVCLFPWCDYKIWKYVKKNLFQLGSIFEFDLKKKHTKKNNFMFQKKVIWTTQKRNSFVMTIIFSLNKGKQEHELDQLLRP